MMHQKYLRVLHSAALLSPPSGILNQMQWEQEAASQLDIAWNVKMYCPAYSVHQNAVTYFDAQVDAKKINSRFAKVIAWFKLRKNYHRWLLSVVDEYDVFVLRYYVHDPFQLWFIKHCPKPVYFVHHTLEVPEMALAGGVGGFVRSKLEAAIGKQCLQAVSGIIGVTDEIVAHQKIRANLANKPTLHYPNGIIYSHEAVLDARANKAPEILFVANFAPWHGLDLLLDAMSQSQENFILHLVGNLLPEDLTTAQNDNRVVLHGRRTHNEIITLSQRCWLGLSSFGLHRNKMQQACPLKTREYLMNGLPVYADHFDVFPTDFPYFIRGDANVLAILKFAKKMRLTDKQKVRMESEPYINKKAVLSRLYQALSAQQF